MRYMPVLALVVAAFLPQGVANEELAGSWYPILQAGNTWAYAEESRDADNDHGIDDPTVGRWTTTETVSNVEVLPEGTRVTIQSKISDLVRLNIRVNSARQPVAARLGRLRTSTSSSLRPRGASSLPASSASVIRHRRD